MCDKPKYVYVYLIGTYEDLYFLKKIASEKIFPTLKNMPSCIEIKIPEKFEVELTSKELENICMR